mmetsp:Transcript_41484/g.97034  ORF Transcript_41484/g.97034 Transcript_41484/m.97034 type:complete len:429 (-) Transcript_41484:31-1317(-)
MWIFFFRRTGVSRADFKDILAAGEFVVADAGEELQVKQLPVGGDAEEGSDEEANLEKRYTNMKNTQSTTLPYINDTYYLVVGGLLDVSVDIAGGTTRAWKSGPATIQDNFSLLNLLGVQQVATVMRNGPMRMAVAEDSTYLQRAAAPPPPATSIARTIIAYLPCLNFCFPPPLPPVPSPPENVEANVEAPTSEAHLYRQLGMVNPSDGTPTPGALLFRWRAGDVLRNVVFTGGFGKDAFRLMASQLALDRQFEDFCLNDPNETTGHLYTELQKHWHSMLKEPIPLHMAQMGLPLYQQCRRSIKPGLRGWVPGPKERAINSISNESHEIGHIAAVHDAIESADNLKRYGERALSFLSTRATALFHHDDRAASTAEPLPALFSERGRTTASKDSERATEYLNKITQGAFGSHGAAREAVKAKASARASLA